MTLLLTLTLTVVLERGEQRKERNTHLSSAATLLTSLALNAAKSSDPFGRIKRHPKAWWYDEAVCERRVRLSLLLIEMMKIARLTSPLHDVLRLSSPSLRHGRRLALLSHPSLTLNLCTLFFVLSLVLPDLPPLPTVPLPGNRLWSLPIT